VAKRRKRRTSATARPRRPGAAQRPRPTRGVKKTTVALLQRELDAARRQLHEAREQQTATSEVLGVISSSPGELEPVFRGVLENATRICGATFGVMFYYQEGVLRPAAELNVPTAFLRVYPAARAISAGTRKYIRARHPHEAICPSRRCRGGRAVFLEQLGQARRRA